MGGEQAAKTLSQIQVAGMKAKGKEVTPFILNYIADNTKGESLDANIALIKHNAKIGAEIAKAYSSITAA